MLLIPVGLLIIIICALSIRYTELCQILKDKDKELWLKLGKPRGYAFSDLGVSITLHTWILNSGYEQSNITAIKNLGRKMLPKATRIKYLLYFGSMVLVLGFILALMGF